jgi:hypothetical protein
MASSSTLTYSPIPLPPSANPQYFQELGRKVEGFNPEDVSSEQMAEIVDMLYRVNLAPDPPYDANVVDSTRSYCSRT